MPERIPRAESGSYTTYKSPTGQSLIPSAYVIESFEDQNLSHWNYQHTNSFGVYSQSGHGGYLSGDYVAESDGAGLGSVMASDPGVVSNPLPHYIEPGDKWTWYVNMHNQNRTQCGFSFARTQSSTQSSNGYYLQLSTTNQHPDSGQFYEGLMIRKDNYADKGTLLNGVSQSWPTDEWLRCDGYWGVDGTIRVTVYSNAGNKINSVETVDTTYTQQGGVAIWNDNIYNNTSITTQFDYIHMR